MFKESFKHKQREIFDWDFALPKQDKLQNSIWHTFRSEVFEKVDESSFDVLYPSHTGRTNSSINEVVNLYPSHTGRPNSPINEVGTLVVIKEL